ncbi:polymer-forming cytoskeletal protein [Aeromonas hydrophila]|nr:polymer-forming cytoskeletal protein [Aeromonas hydrophila]
MPERILARIAMRPRSDALYLIWFCWSLALLLYVAGSAYYKLPIVPLLLMVLLLMVEKTKMFGRKRNESEVVGVGSTTTVIAKGARFKGELQVEGNLDVYGQFVGTLQLNGGTVRIMEGGRIEGDVSAAHVIINGTLDGTCASSEVEILENGKMKGLFKGGSLSIRKGGQFVGQSQSQEEQKGESKANVKQLQPEGKNKAVDTAEVVAKQA